MRGQRMHHDLRRAEPHIERAEVGAPQRFARIAVHVDPHEDVAVGRLVERQRVGDAAIDQDVIGVMDGLEQRRDGDRSRDRWSQQALVEHGLVPGLEIGGHHIERNLQFREILGEGLGEEGIDDAVAVQLHVEAVLQQAAEIADLRAPQSRGDDPHRAEHAHRMLAQFLAGHAVGPARADERADRRAGDHRGLESQLIHRFDEGNVRKSTGRAAAQRHADPRHAALVGTHDGLGLAAMQAVNQLLSPLDDGDQFFLFCEVVSHNGKIGCARKV